MDKCKHSKNKDLKEWNPRRSDEQDVEMTSSGIPLTQIFVYKIIFYFTCDQYAYHDVVSILVTSESNRSMQAWVKNSR